MYKLLSAFVISGLLFSCSSTKQTTDNSTNSSTAEGWKQLFDGTTTKGWHRYGGGKIDSVWKVSDGVLWLDVQNKKAQNIKGDWDIVTDEEYENFELEAEWKISANGNSGILFMVHEVKQKYNWPWETGPEMQVVDNNGHPDAKVSKHRAGDLYDLIACRIETAKPAGQWNKVKIKMENSKLEMWLNDTDVVTTMIGDANWNKLVAGSKWRNYPDFAAFKRGHIGLQDHGDAVYYRNIRIRRL